MFLQGRGHRTVECNKGNVVDSISTSEKNHEASFNDNGTIMYEVSYMLNEVLMQFFSFFLVMMDGTLICYL